MGKKQEGGTMASIIVALIIVLIVAIFSVQNAAPVAISFLFWQFQASLAIIIFLCVLSGIIVGSILTFLIRIKRQRKEKQASPGTSPREKTNSGK
jgi:lipopolysaccharide assembly protein A